MNKKKKYRSPVRIKVPPNKTIKSKKDYNRDDIDSSLKEAYDDYLNDLARQTPGWDE
jgi:hypothetical protein